jgi:hypothetical protein
MRISEDLSGCNEEALKILDITRTILNSCSDGLGSWGGSGHQPMPPRFARAMLTERYVAAERWIICPPLPSPIRTYVGWLQCSTTVTLETNVNLFMHT